nr:reverse transcriptase domain-containing protein [Tanacetum cinerariifolium]
ELVVDVVRDCREVVMEVARNRGKKINSTNTNDPHDTPMEDKEALLDPWILFTNGSSCIDGSGVGLIITNPKGVEFTYALRFRFDATNNEKGQIPYHTFKKFSITQVPRGENKKEDALSKMVSTSFAHLTMQVLVEELKEKSIEKREVLAVVKEEGRTWVTPIYEYPWRKFFQKKKGRKDPYATRQGIGIAGPFLEGPGKAKFLIVAIDYFTKWIEVKPVATITDNPFKDWCEKLCIRQRFTSVKHPQANILVEKENKSLGEGIRARLEKRCKNWIEEISHVLWARRTMIKSSNGETPFSLTYGTKAVIPVEIIMPTLRLQKLIWKQRVKPRCKSTITSGFVTQVSGQETLSTGTMKQATRKMKASSDLSRKDHMKSQKH